MKTGGDITRRKVLDVALELFTSKPYDKVTLKEIETATGLSRGALMYHFPNKESLFKEAVDMFVFRNNTLTAVPEDCRGSLFLTIEAFVSLLKEEQQYWRSKGIDNLNFALLTIECSYFNLSRESLEATYGWYENECRIWREVIERSIRSGEIREVDADIVAHLLEDCYLGDSYAGLTQPHGYSPDFLHRELTAIYTLLRR